MGLVRLGTSSWSEKGWLGSFYPKGLPAGGFLGHYATRFPAVEADVTYYRIPSAAMVRGWRERTPKSFRLCAKFPRSIVHGGEGARPDGARILTPEFAYGPCEVFLSAMESLGERAGLLILQFPYLRKEIFPSLGSFLDRLVPFLDQLPKGGAYGLEIRNREWLQNSLLEVLRERAVTLVLAELPSMPHPDSLGQELDLVTSDSIYVRLIGDRRVTNALTKTFSEVVLDQGPRLERWADWLAPMTARVKETYVFANNHFAGHGPASATALGGLLTARGVALEPAPGRTPGELF